MNKWSLEAIDLRALLGMGMLGTFGTFGRIFLAIHFFPIDDA
jgi:hypothetical protein